MMVLSKIKESFEKVLKFDVWNMKEVDIENGYVRLLYKDFKGTRNSGKKYGRFDDRINEVVGDCFVGNENESFDYYEYIGKKNKIYFN